MKAFLALFLLIAPQLEAAVLDSSVISRWFSGSATNVDANGGTNTNLTMVGTVPTTSTNCPSSGIVAPYSFSATNYYSMQSGTLAQLTTTGSWSFGGYFYKVSRAANTYAIELKTVGDGAQTVGIQMGFASGDDIRVSDATTDRIVYANTALLGHCAYVGIRGSTAGLEVWLGLDGGVPAKVSSNTYSFPMPTTTVLGYVGTFKSVATIFPGTMSDVVFLNNTYTAFPYTAPTAASSSSQLSPYKGPCQERSPLVTPCWGLNQ